MPNLNMSDANTGPDHSAGMSILMSLKRIKEVYMEIRRRKSHRIVNGRLPLL